MTFPLISGRYPCLVTWATWNPSDKSSLITLSNGNDTATGPNTLGATHAAVRATISKSAGKYHFEVVTNIEMTSATSWGIGFANGAASLNSNLGVDTNSIAWYFNGHVDFNGSTISTVGSYAPGTTLAIEFDAGAGQMWFLANPGATYNNNGANPATGSSGIPLSVTTGPFFPAWNTAPLTGYGIPGEQVTANFGASAFAVTPSSGFSGISTVSGVKPPTTPGPIIGIWLAGNPTIGSILASSPHYNHITYVFLYGPDNSGTVVLDTSAYGGNGTALAADVATWKSSVDATGRQRTIVALVVDAFTGNGSANYLTPTNATNAFNSIVSAVNTYGFQGIEWDLEGGEGTTWNATTINSINSQLKAHFGSSFVIGQTPRPFECHAGATKRGWMSTLDYTTMQYYFGGTSGPFACTQIQALEGGTDGNSEGLSQFINGTDGGVTIPTSKLIFGQYVTGLNQTGCTPAQYETAFANLIASYPGLRGAQVWQSAVDSGNGFSFGSTFGPLLGL